MEEDKHSRPNLQRPCSIVYFQEFLSTSKSKAVTPFLS